MAQNKQIPNTADPKIIEYNNVRLFEDQSYLANDQTALKLDEQWAKNSFLIKDSLDNLDPTDIQNRTFSSNVFKFVDSSLGGSKCINPRPQYTRYSDNRAKGLLKTRRDVATSEFTGNNGLGRYFSEAFDDNQQLIYLRFGHPQFNSLTTFFSGFYNNSAGRFARTGRTNDFFFGVGESLGKGIGLVGQIVIWPITASIMIGNMYRFFFNKPSSRFYYFKPNMLGYWSAVNTMVNTIAVNRGLMPKIFKDGFNRTTTDQKVNDVYRLDDDYLKKLSQLLGDAFTETGGYDIYAVAGKAQRNSIIMDKKIYEDFNNQSFSDFYGYARKTAQTNLENPRGNRTFTNALQDYMTSDLAKPEEGDEVGYEQDIRSKIDPNASKDANPKSVFPESISNYFDAEFNDGTAFACFRVDHTGPVQESFSNSVGENELASKLNSVSGAARNFTFSAAGGNVADIPILGDILGAAIDTAKGLISGLADSLHISGLASLGGAAFVDIPKYWQSSTANLPRVNYTMQLISPYGNVVSQMNNIYIPLAMILAGGLPLSTGKQSYTSPFICQLFDQGRYQTRLGIIDSISITRGTSNLSFNKNKNAMAIDVTFSIMELSSIVHLPISKGYGGSQDGIFDDENYFSDYMAMLGSLGLWEQFYTFPKAMLRLAKATRNLEKLKSPAMWAMYLHERTPVGMLDVLYKGSNTISDTGIR